MSDQNNFEFTSENMKKYEEILPLYDDTESALLPVLHLAQEQNSYLSKAVVKKVSEMMEIPETRINEVISFYDMFYDQPVGKNIIQVCTNITCSMYGGRDIFDGLLKEFKTQNMTPCEGGKYYFQKMECLGA